MVILEQSYPYSDHRYFDRMFKRDVDEMISTSCERCQPHMNIITRFVHSIDQIGHHPRIIAVLRQNIDVGRISGDLQEPLVDTFDRSLHEDSPHLFDHHRMTFAREDLDSIQTHIVAITPGTFQIEHQLFTARQFRNAEPSQDSISSDLPSRRLIDLTVLLRVHCRLSTHCW